MVKSAKSYNYFPDGPMYSDESSPRIGRKIIGSNTRPTVNPTPFPKLLAVRFCAQIKNTKLKYGIKNSNNQYQGLPITFSHTIVEYIGTIAAQPGLPAFLYKNQLPIICGKIKISSIINCHIPITYIRKKLLNIFLIYA